MRETNGIIRERKGSILRQFRIQTTGFKVFYVLMWGLVIATMVISIIEKKYENTFMCVLTLILFAMPLYIERRIQIDLPDALIEIIVLFIFAAEILGNLSAWYVKVPWWDTMLHTLNGFLAAAVGFSMINILNKSENIAFEMSPLFVAITAFCFSMTIGVLWEFFEYSMDYFFLTDMQKDTVINQFSTVLLDQTLTNTPVAVRGIQDVTINGTDLGLGGYIDIGLNDTMKDLIVNFIGALVFSVLGYLYVKFPRKFKWISGLLPRRMSESEYNAIYPKDGGE